MTHVFDENGVELLPIRENSECNTDQNYDSWFTMGMSIMHTVLDMFIGLLENLVSQATGINVAKSTFWQDFVKKGIHQGAEQMAYAFIG